MKMGSSRRPLILVFMVLLSPFLLNCVDGADLLHKIRSGIDLANQGWSPTRMNGDRMDTDDRQPWGPTMSMFHHPGYNPDEFSGTYYQKRQDLRPFLRNDDFNEAVETKRRLVEIPEDPVVDQSQKTMLLGKALDSLLNYAFIVLPVNSEVVMFPLNDPGKVKKLNHGQLLRGA